MLAPPKSQLESSHIAIARPLAIMRWLLFVAAFVVVMVIVGGITRLTESGLSITQWNPITGALPPLNDAAWQREFALYQATTEYQTVNRGMSMADFQTIYFWEWFHRFLARMVGVVYALPLLWFAWKRAIPAGFGTRLTLLLMLGGLQGVVGWWMVASGLVGRTDVSHYRLAVHLNLALLILGLLVWTARDMWLHAQARLAAATKARLRWPVALVFFLLAVQLVWGAFTAGLNAGFAFASWPLMGDEIFPAATPWTQPIIANLIDNPIVVQFIHRWWAFVAGAALLWLALRCIRIGAKGPGMILAGLIFLQIALGIATLLSGVAISLGVAHQAVGALLVAAAAWCGHSLCQTAGDTGTAAPSAR